MRSYVVWVGGVIVNNHLLTEDKAEDLADDYKADGYDDVAIENINNIV
jgi:hypothetical protein